MTAVPESNSTLGAPVGYRPLLVAFSQPISAVANLEAADRVQRISNQALSPEPVQENIEHAWNDLPGKTVRLIRRGDTLEYEVVYNSGPSYRLGWDNVNLDPEHIRRVLQQPAEARQASCWSSDNTAEHTFDKIVLVAVGEIVLVALALIAGALAIANLVPGGLHFPVAATYTLGAVSIASLIGAIIVHNKKIPPNVFGRAAYQKLFGIDIGPDPDFPAGFDRKTLKSTEMLVRIQKAPVEIYECLGFRVGRSYDSSTRDGITMSSPPENTSEWVLMHRKTFEHKKTSNPQIDVKALYAEKLAAIQAYNPQFKIAHISEALIYLAIQVASGVYPTGICCEGYRLNPEKPLNVSWNRKCENEFSVDLAARRYGVLAVRRFPANA